MASKQAPTLALGWPVCFLGASQTISYTGTAGQSTAVDLKTSVIIFQATSDCFIKIGVNPTATTADHLVKAGSVRHFAIEGGQMASFIQSTASGTIYMTEALGAQ
jgi:hypothetical protein